MDAFFASVEMLHHPEWRGKPLIVGSGAHERGVVSTCNYEARKFGVHSAMPSRTAYALCPKAIFCPPHMELYKEVSKKAFQVFESFTPYVEGVSIDEAFLDVTSAIKSHASPRALGEALRAAVKRECGVTCSVGLAPNRLLAKLGSEANKPDGLTLVPTDPESIAAFLSPRPIGDLWGVGPKLRESLRPYGITLCGDIQRLVGLSPADVWREGLPAAPEALTAILGETASLALAGAAFGLSSDTVHWQGREEKSVSREHTFDEDETSRAAVKAMCLKLASEVGVRFRKEPRWARTARIKLRDASFKTLTRQMPFPAPARDDFAFRAAAAELFEAAWPKKRAISVRLVGFGVTNIQETPDDGGVDLFGRPGEEDRKKHERLSEALDALRKKGLPVNLGE